MRIWSQSTCRNRFQSGLITDSMMCVSKPQPPPDATCNVNIVVTKERDTVCYLQGDSGSSVIYKSGESYESVGVVSWGIEGCQTGAPSVMARVTYFLDWIVQEISDSSLCPREPVPSPSTAPPSSCITVSGAVVGAECVFPFVVANISITGCTKIDGDQTAWCATALDDQVRHNSDDDKVGSKLSHLSSDLVISVM